MSSTCSLCHVKERDSGRRRGTRKRLIFWIYLLHCCSAGSSCWCQCCLGRSGLYLRSRPREVMPYRKVWTNHRQRVAVLLIPLSLQGAQTRNNEQKAKMAAVSCVRWLISYLYYYLTVQYIARFEHHLVDGRVLVILTCTPSKKQRPQTHG